MTKNFAVTIQKDRYDINSLELFITRNGYQWTTISHSKDELLKIAYTIMKYLDEIGYLDCLSEARTYRTRKG